MRGQTLFFSKKPAVLQKYTIVGKKEGEGPLKDGFDEILTDDMWGENTWEQAESKLIQQAVLGALRCAALSPHDIDLLFCGDLLNQCAGSNYGIRVFPVPVVGLFGACSTMGLSLICGAAAMEGGFAKKCIAATSSHFCTAERQFRFPLEYGGQRPPSAQQTVTGAGCVVLGERGNIVISHATVGKIVDRGICDANNMGAAMAPAAADTLRQHFQAVGTQPRDYDRIYTGDLGAVGKSIVTDLLLREGYDLRKNYYDCGELIFSSDQDVHAGGSGCGCSAAVLCAHILPALQKGETKRVLFAPTGALMSTTAVQQGNSIPAVCHAVEFALV